MPTPLPLRQLFAAIALATLPALASAQTPAVTEADYARAERLTSYLAQPLVDHQATRIDWLDATHVVYVDHDAKGNQLLQLDTATGKSAPIFKRDFEPLPHLAQSERHRCGKQQRHRPEREQRQGPAGVVRSLSRSDRAGAGRPDQCRHGEGDPGQASRAEI